MSSKLKADLTLLEESAASAPLSGSATVGATLTLLPGTAPSLSGTAALTADLDVAYKISASIPGPEHDISCDMEAGADLSATLTDAAAASSVAIISPPTPGSPAAAAGTGPSTPGQWKSFQIKIPGKDVLSSVRNALETLLVFLEIVKAILETIKVFLVDFGNPIKALVEAVLRLLNQLFELLKRTGLYAYYDVPDLPADPEMWAFQGGYAAFVNRFKGSVLDTRDPNRPQPVSGATKSGFILFVVDAGNSVQLLALMKQLLRFFGKDFIAPQYAAPANFKVLPIGDKQDPILAVAKVFASQPKAVALEWSATTSMQPRDPGFTDLVTRLGTELYPPKFLIERSEVPVNQELASTDVNTLGKAGTVFHTYDSDFELRGKPGRRIKRKVKMTDEYGDPFIKFQTYAVVSLTDTPTAFFLGQLGKFRFIDTNVEFGKTYFYRVRAFSGDLVVDTKGQIPFVLPGTKPSDKDKVSNTFLIRWPGKDPKFPPTMGRASQTARIHLTKIPPNFDVVEDLRRLFQTAFSLNFHLQPGPEDKFDADGNPVGATLKSAVGKGSLSRQASQLAAFVGVPLIGKGVSEVGAPGEEKNDYAADPITGKLPELPWQKGRVRRQSARLASTVASAFLENGSAVIEQFRAIMQTAPLPKGTVSVTGLTGADTIEKIVLKLTEVTDNEAVGATAAQAAATLYGDVYADVAFRKNILHAIQFVTSFTLGGTPPDWVKIAILRDVIPWSGQFLYDMMAKIQALVDAFKGTTEEIKDFIALLVRKIDAMERFIEYLISMLDYIEGLAIGAYVLAVPGTGGGVQDWFNLIDTAGGTKPSSGPNGYSGGVALAYVYPNVSPLGDAIKAAWEAIF